MKTKLLLISILLFAFLCNATEETNETGKKRVVLSDIGTHPPHIIDIDEPVAMYTVSTEVIDITFDANYYSQYTIYLSGPYAEMEYFVTTPTVYLPVSTMDEVIEIYIESEDCGCYYGILDRSDSGSME